MNEDIPETPQDESAIEQIFQDPSASYWLKNALRLALLRDPADAANDAEVLCRLLDRRCSRLLRDPDAGNEPSS